MDEFVKRPKTAFPFMVRYFTMDGKTNSYGCQNAFAMIYRRANGAFYEYTNLSYENRARKGERTFRRKSCANVLIFIRMLASNCPDTSTAGIRILPRTVQPASQVRSGAHKSSGDRIWSFHDMIFDNFMISASCANIDVSAKLERILRY